MFWCVHATKPLRWPAQPPQPTKRLKPHRWACRGVVFLGSLQEVQKVHVRMIARLGALSTMATYLPVNVDQFERLLCCMIGAFEQQALSSITTDAKL